MSPSSPRRLRRSFQRIVTGLSVSTLALGSGLAVASSAQADVIPFKSHCVNFFTPDLPDQDIEIDLVVTPEKPVYQVGERVQVTWVWAKYPKAPPTIPVVGEVPENSTYPVGQIAVGGAQQGWFDAIGPQENPRVLPGEEFILSRPVGSFTLTQAGAVTLTPDTYQTWTTALGFNVPTQCNPVNPVAVSRTLNVEGESYGPATLAAPAGTVKSGDQLALTGTGWPDGPPAVAELCLADGTQCNAKRIPANTLVGADRGLTGSVTIGSGLATGDYLLRVRTEATSATLPISVTEVPRTLQATPDHGESGTTITVSGTGFSPNAMLYITGCDASGQATWEPIDYPITDASGAFTVELPGFGLWYNQGIHATDLDAGSLEMCVPWRFEYDTDVQHITGRIIEGGLTISQEHSGVELSAITLNGTDQTMTGDINTVTVRDTRVAGEGWSLTGTIGDFTTPEGGLIAADQFAWTPAVAASDPASVGVPRPGSSGPVAGGATLATMDPAAAGSTTAGTYAADAAVTLAVPGFQKPGTYTATLTLSLS